MRPSGCWMCDPLFCCSFGAGVLKVIDVKRQQASGQRPKKDKQQGKGAVGGKQQQQQQPAVTGALALKALLQPAAADVGVGAGLPAWD